MVSFLAAWSFQYDVTKKAYWILPDIVLHLNLWSLQIVNLRVIIRTPIDMRCPLVKRGSTFPGVSSKHRAIVEWGVIERLPLSTYRKGLTHFHTRLEYPEMEALGRLMCQSSASSLNVPNIGMYLKVLVAPGVVAKLSMTRTCCSGSVCYTVN